MSRIISVILLLIGPVLVNGLMACQDPCHPTPYRFGILDYRAYPRKVTDQSYKAYLIDTLVLGDSVTYRQLEILLIGQETTVVTHERPTGGSALWACDPAVIATDSIYSLNVTSRQPYWSGLSTHTDLGTILTIGVGPYDQRPLAQFLTMPVKFASPFFSLRFTQAPEKAGLYQFEVRLSWGQGKTAIFLTRPIFVKT